MTGFLAALAAVIFGPLGLVVAPSPEALPNDLSATGFRQTVLRSAMRQTRILPLAAEAPAHATDPMGALRPYRLWEVEPPVVDAKAAVVMGAKSGKVLYEREHTVRRPIASITKLATALAVVDAEANLATAVPVSARAIGMNGDYGGLVAGERLTVRNLLAAMLIASSNDAASALEEHIRAKGGSLLIDRMNGVASRLALADTHFASPHGLVDAGNFSSARDVAKLLAAAYAHKDLAPLLSSPGMDITSVDGAHTHRLVPSNRLMGVFDHVVAGKTGFTTAAGGCLAVVAKNPDGDEDLIIVVLGSSTEETRFTAVEELITWTHNAYRW